MTNPSRERGLTQRILRNAGSILLGDLGGEVLTTYAVGLAAVSLGPAGFGTLSEAQAFMEPFEAAAGFGLAQVAITVSARSGGCDGLLRGTVAAVRLGLAVVSVALAAIFAAVSGRVNLLPLIWLLSVAILFTPLQASSLLPFQFNHMRHRLVAIPFLGSVVRVGTAYLAFHFLNVPAGYQASVCAAALTTALLTYRAARKHFPERLRFDRTLARDVLRLAWPVALLEVIVVLYTRASYMLLRSAGPQVQGEYAAAERLLRPIFGIASALFASALPALAVLAAERSFTMISRIYLKSIARLSIVVAPIVLVACWILPSALESYAPSYVGASAPFRWLAVGAFFMLLNQLSTMFVVALGKFRAILFVAIINMFVYFALAVKLVPKYQAEGAAIATTLMEATNSVLQLILVYWLLRRARTA